MSAGGRRERCLDKASEERLLKGEKLSIEERKIICGEIMPSY